MKRFPILLTLCIPFQLHGQIGPSPENSGNDAYYEGTISPRYTNHTLANNPKPIRVKSPKEDMGWDLWNTYEFVPDKYLIVTVSEYQNDIQNFVQWKKITGRDVHVSMKQRGTWTTAEVVDTISSYFDTYGVKYLLIVGGESDVPSIDKSDYYYGLPTGSPPVPQILRGRIPVSTSADVRNVLKKIIIYEKTPIMDDSFYQKGLHCAEFIDKVHTLNVAPPRPALEIGSDGCEDKCFTLISEEIRHHLTENWAKDINYIYHAEEDVFPTQWDAHTYSNGDSISEELMRDNYAWNGSTDDIVNAINNGAFYVLYNGRGAVNGWLAPSLDTFNVAQLQNTSKLPVIFSIADNTGLFQSDSTTCLAEQFLKNQNGGSVAVLASTDFVSAGNSSAMTLAMFDAIWPRLQLQYGNFRLDAIQTGGYWWDIWGDSIWIDTYRKPVYSSAPPHSSIKELGAILDYGLQRLTNIMSLESGIPSEWKSFHCFGDPSMVFITEKPHTFVEPTIFIQNDTAFVMVSDGDCQITFYDRNSGNIKTYIGDCAGYPNPSDNLHISLKRDNYIPYIWNSDADVFIQNETIQGENRVYRGGKICIGKNVTNTKPQGDVNIVNSNITIQGSELELHPGTFISSNFQFQNH
ncbi:MAG: hypothetical protein IJ064_02440 [Bacteroidaceae bacterium]|nr:hypothetical protein [Bacteroidaceae bacterium]